MTNKILDNLSREELLELALAQQQQIEQLQQQLAAWRSPDLSHTARQLRGLFKNAQQAADRYLESAAAVQAMQEDESALRLAQTEARCRDMLAQAEEKSAYYWVALQKRVEEFLASQPQVLQPQQAVASDAPGEERFGPDD